MSPANPKSIEALKHAPRIPGVLEIILQRWSPRAFSDKAVSPEEARKLFEAARWAASSSNEQPWRFFVGYRGDATYQKILDCLVEGNRAWAKAAPLLILSVARSTFSHDDSPNRFALHDTGAATAYLALQATALGMHAHSMAGLDAKKARVVFDVPSDYEIGAVTAVGYLGDPDGLPDRLREKETALRVRKPLKEFVFSDWETPAEF